MPHEAPEIIEVDKTRIACDGGIGGHPRVWLQMPSSQNWVECPYCDTKFVLTKGVDAGH